MVTVFGHANTILYRNLIALVKLYMHAYFLESVLPVSEKIYF